LNSLRASSPLREYQLHVWLLAVLSPAEKNLTTCSNSSEKKDRVVLQVQLSEKASLTNEKPA